MTPANDHDLRGRLRRRLAQLKSELEKGKQKLESLEAEAGQLRQTLLRISGATQVLEEELAQAEELPAENHDARQTG